MKVKCIDAKQVEHFGMSDGAEYHVMRESEVFYYFLCTDGTGICKSRFITLVEEPLPTFILGFSRTLSKPNKSLTRECPCGIFRADCDYHKD